MRRLMLLVGASGRSPRAAPRFRFALVLVLVIVEAAIAASAPSQALKTGVARATAAPSPVAGIWRRLSPAPITPSLMVSVWTGKKMLNFGRAQPDAPWSVNVAAAYDPGRDAWQLLEPPPGLKGNYEGRYWAVWTGKEMLVSGPATYEAFNPATNQWRRLLKSIVPDGIVVWTGREMVGWGGGCCGDASSEGAAYNPATNTRRRLARSPLAPEQRPIGAWTGRELVVFVSGINPADGKPWPAGLSRAAAYNPATNTWRRIATLPEPGGAATWDGNEILVVGGGPSGRSVNAYAPATNRWRRLASMPSQRSQAATVWTGKRLLIWGGRTSRDDGALAVARRGLAFDPKANRWSALPWAPLLGRLDPTAVWTGHAMIVWGGNRPNVPVNTGQRVFADGAAFRPATP